MTRLNWVYIALLFTAGTLWGVAFLFADISLDTIPPFTYTFARNVLVAIVLVIALYATGGRLPRFGRAWWPFFVVGLFDNALPVMLSTNALLFVDSGLVTIYVSTTPFFTLLLAWRFIQDEKISRSQILGIAVGMVGILVLIGPAAFQNLGANLWSQIALLCASLCYAIATVYSRGFLREENNEHKRSVLEWLTGQFVASTVIILPMVLLFDDVPAIRPSTTSLIALFISAWILTIFAFLSFYRLNALAGPTYASFVTYLIPINGVFWGAIVRDEQVTAGSLIALGLILFGVAVVNDLIPIFEGNNDEFA